MKLLPRLFFATIVLAFVPQSWSNDSAARPREGVLSPMPLRKILNDSKAVSKEGRDIMLLARTSPTVTRNFLVQGGLHGDERLAQEFVVWLAERYSRGQSLLNQLDARGVSVDFLPHANPDGIHLNDRSNTSGVNLNRNFGTLWGVSRENPGAYQFSEPETAAIKKLFEQKKYISAVDVHGYINWIVTPSSPKMVGKANSPRDVQRFEKWISAIEKETKTLPGYKVKSAGELGDGGAFEDWAFWEQGSLSYCLELKSPHRFAANHITAEAETRTRRDLFLDYERFILNMFEQSLKIQDQVETAFLPRPSLAG